MPTFSDAAYFNSRFRRFKVMKRKEASEQAMDFISADLVPSSFNGNALLSCCWTGQRWTARVICRHTSDEETDNITLLETLINIEAMPTNRAESYLEEYLYVKNGFLSMTLIEMYSPPT